MHRLLVEIYRFFSLPFVLESVNILGVREVEEATGILPSTVYFILTCLGVCVCFFFSWLGPCAVIRVSPLPFLPPSCILSQSAFLHLPWHPPTHLPTYLPSHKSSKVNTHSLTHTPILTFFLVFELLSPLAWVRDAVTDAITGARTRISSELRS